MIDHRMDAAAVATRSACTLHGIVSAVDAVNHAVKVILKPDDVETGWLADACGVSAGDLRIARPCEVGTHVILLPSEGDAEHLTIVGVVFDTVLVPPVSPHTGQVAQAGEMLIMSGCGSPPVSGGRDPGDATGSAPWWHITAKGLYSGAGLTSIALEDGQVMWKVNDIYMSLTSSGLRVVGSGITCDGDIVSSQVSLQSHVHSNGNMGANTGIPLL